MRATGLYALKPRFLGRLRSVEDRLVALSVSPNALTWAAVGISALGGAALALGGALDRPLLWLAVPPLGLLRLALNTLDGAVARRTGKSTPGGAALNEMCDRASDVLLLAGTWTLGSPLITLAALTGSLVTSHTAVLSQALTGVRPTSGPMGKADRVAVLAAGAAAAAGARDALPLQLALAAIACGTVVTTALRLRGMKSRVAVR